MLVPAQSFLSIRSGDDPVRCFFWIPALADRTLPWLVYRGMASEISRKASTWPPPDCAAQRPGKPIAAESFWLFWGVDRGIFDFGVVESGISV